eukprot:gene2225-2367_t
MSGKGKKESKLPPFLPPEAAKFAKQLGLDIHGLEPEAQHLWNHLEKLSTENPVEYERFIAEQMSAAKEDESTGNEQKGGRAFRPAAEFVIETKTFDGDGTVIREVNGRAVEGKPLYINICSSDLIEIPKDKGGKPIDSSRSVADGLEIPLLIGPVRAISEQYNAIDVIFHPIVPKICREERYFRGQILELAQDWILQETKVKFKKNSYEDILTDVCRYKGGLGDKNDIPVLFNIDDDLLQEQDEQKQSSNDQNKSNPSSSFNPNQPDPSLGKKNDKNIKGTAKSSNVLSSTETLLKEIQRTKESSTIDEMKTISTTQIKKDGEPKLSSTTDKEKDTNKEKEAKKSGPMIQEIGKEKTNSTNSLKNSNPQKEDLKAIKEKKYKEPSKVEKQVYQDLLDHFENPDAYNPLDSINSEDAEATLIKDLAKMLTADQIPSTLQNIPPPAPPQASNIIPSQPSNPVSKPSQHTLTTTSALLQSSPILRNSHPNIASVKYSFDQDNQQYVMEISRFKPSATNTSFELTGSKSEIKLMIKIDAFEGSDTALGCVEEKLSIRFEAEKNKKFLPANVRAAIKRKAQTLSITIPLEKNIL